MFASFVAANGCISETQHEHVIPVGNIYELCFKKELKQLKHATHQYPFTITLEQGDKVPDSYRKTGVLSILNIIAKEPGRYINVLVDSEDESRNEYKFISVDNKAN